MQNKKHVLGVDIGATLVKVGLVEKGGKIVSKTSFLTKKFVSKKAFIKRLIEEIGQVIKNNRRAKGNLSGIGIGIPGTVDYSKGIVHNLTNIKGWKEVPLKKILRKFFKTPVFIDNDANAFACGQLKWGACRGAKNAICVTLGSGIGGGLIIEGGVYRGSNYSAGEIGHICIDINGPGCGCGSKGCMEAFVGNKYIINRVIKQIKEGRKTSLVDMVGGKLQKITPELLTKAAKNGDKFSIEIWKETGTYLGIGLSGLVNVLNPERIIIGGGISKAGKFIFTPLKKELVRRTMNQHLKALKVMRANFVDEAGITGAASLVIENK
ncbi:MAG: ROK family protein [Candidatus Omnitrophota bacterium]|nr:MAG: ROK family protein [Candidatus Omnitrophota bacterium]